MDQVDNHPGGYAFAPGISPYSAGVAALAEHRIVRVALRHPVPWQEGFELIDQVLDEAGRPSVALCSIELRCPEPHSFDGFGSFNDDYRGALSERGILLNGGVNPVARTNVAPALVPPTETSLFAFGYTVPDPGRTRPSFIVSGAGDLRRQEEMRPEAIVGGASRWVSSGAERAGAVVSEIESRLVRLGLTWADTDTVTAYTVQDLHAVLEPVVLPRLGAAAGRGVHWYYAEPPIEGLLYEMDARGGVDGAPLR